MIKSLYSKAYVNVEVDFASTLLEVKCKDTCKYISTYTGLFCEGYCFYSQG